MRLSKLKNKISGNIISDILCKLSYEKNFIDFFDIHVPKCISPKHIF
jgi:hypothetical protein